MKIDDRDDVEELTEGMSSVAKAEARAVQHGAAWKVLVLGHGGSSGEAAQL